MREVCLYLTLEEAINHNNKDLIEFLLSKNVRYDNALILAMNEPNIDIVDIILKHDSSPEFVNKVSSMGTALSIATYKNDIKIVKRLLSVPGINLSLYDGKDRTPIMLSIMNLNIDMLNEFLDFYGDEIQSEIWQIDRAIKIILSTLVDKISHGIPNINSDANNKNRLLLILKRILEIKNIDPNSHGGQHTLISYACEENDIDMVKLLLNLERINVNAYALDNGNTPLMFAIINGNIEIAELIINDPRTNINARNYFNKSALILAAEKQLEEIVNLIIKNEKFDPIKSNANYAFCISTGSISEVLLSIKSIDVNYMVENIERRNNNNKSLKLNYGRRRIETSLTLAVEKQDENKIDLIIQHPSFDKVKSQFFLSIFDAVVLNSVPIFRKLIKLNDDDVNISLYSGPTLFCTAVNNSSLAMISEILNYDKFDSIKSGLVDVFTGLFDNNQEFKSDVANLIINYDRNHMHLIDLNMIFSNGKTFLTSLSRHKNEHALVFCLQHGADPNMPNSFGIYVLEQAIVQKNLIYSASLLGSNLIDMNVKIPFIPKNDSDKLMILSDGLEINEYKNFKFPPKIEYLTYHHLAMIVDCTLEAFMYSGFFDVNATDSQGETPLMYACRNSQIKKIDILFNRKNIDYLHCNNDGKDALAILNYSENHPQDKNEYKQALLSLLNDKKNNFPGGFFGFQFGKK